MADTILTPQMKQVLRDFARANGRQWRRKVRTIWENGAVEGTPEHDILALKPLGEKWLVNYEPEGVKTSFTLDKAVAEGRISSADRDMMVDAHERSGMLVKGNRAKLDPAVAADPTKLREIISHVNTAARAILTAGQTFKELGDEHHAFIALRATHGLLSTGFRWAQEYHAEEDAERLLKTTQDAVAQWEASL